VKQGTVIANHGQERYANARRFASHSMPQGRSATSSAQGNRISCRWRGAQSSPPKQVNGNRSAETGQREPRRLAAVAERVGNVRYRPSPARAAFMSIAELGHEPAWVGAVRAARGGVLGVASTHLFDDP